MHTFATNVSRDTLQSHDSTCSCFFSDTSLKCLLRNDTGYDVSKPNLFGVDNVHDNPSLSAIGDDVRLVEHKAKNADTNLEHLSQT